MSWYVSKNQPEGSRFKTTLVRLVGEDSWRPYFFDLDKPMHGIGPIVGLWCYTSQEEAKAATDQWWINNGGGVE